jgi:hypothetical protein
MSSSPSNTTTSLSPPKPPPKPLSLNTNGREDCGKVSLGECNKLLSETQTSTKGMEGTVNKMSTTVEACREILGMNSGWIRRQEAGRNSENEIFL